MLYYSIFKSIKRIVSIYQFSTRANHSVNSLKPTVYLNLSEFTETLQLMGIDYPRKISSGANNCFEALLKVKEYNILDELDGIRYLTSQCSNVDLTSTSHTPFNITTQHIREKVLLLRNVMFVHSFNIGLLDTNCNVTHVYYPALSSRFLAMSRDYLSNSFESKDGIINLYNIDPLRIIQIYVFSIPNYNLPFALSPIPSCLLDNYLSTIQSNLNTNSFSLSLIHSNSSQSETPKVSFNLVREVLLIMVLSGYGRYQDREQLFSYFDTFVFSIPFNAICLKYLCNATTDASSSVFSVKVKSMFYSLKTEITTLNLHLLIAGSVRLSIDKSLVSLFLHYSIKSNRHLSSCYFASMDYTSDTHLRSIGTDSYLSVRFNQFIQSYINKYPLPMHMLQWNRFLFELQRLFYSLSPFVYNITSEADGGVYMVETSRNSTSFKTINPLVWLKVLYLHVYLSILSFNVTDKDPYSDVHSVHIDSSKALNLAHLSFIFSSASILLIVSIHLLNSYIEVDGIQDLHRHLVVGECLARNTIKEYFRRYSQLLLDYSSLYYKPEIDATNKQFFSYLNHNTWVYFNYVNVSYNLEPNLFQYSAHMLKPPFKFNTFNISTGPKGPLKANEFNIELVNLNKLKTFPEFYYKHKVNNIGHTYLGRDTFSVKWILKSISQHTILKKSQTTSINAPIIYSISIIEPVIGYFLNLLSRSLFYTQFSYLSITKVNEDKTLTNDKRLNRLLNQNKELELVSSITSFLLPSLTYLMEKFSLIENLVITWIELHNTDVYKLLTNWKKYTHSKCQYLTQCMQGLHSSNLSREDLISIIYIVPCLIQLILDKHNLLQVKEELIYSLFSLTYTQDLEEMRLINIFFIDLVCIFNYAIYMLDKNFLTQSTVVTAIRVAYQSIGKLLSEISTQIVQIKSKKHYLLLNTKKHSHPYYAMSFNISLYEEQIDVNEYVNIVENFKIFLQLTNQLEEKVVTALSTFIFSYHATLNDALVNGKLTKSPEVQFFKHLSFEYVYSFIQLSDTFLSKLSCYLELKPNQLDILKNVMSSITVELHNRLYFITTRPSYLFLTLFINGFITTLDSVLTVLSVITMYIITVNNLQIFAMPHSPINLNQTVIQVIQRLSNDLKVNTTKSSAKYITVVGNYAIPIKSKETSSPVLFINNTGLLVYRLLNLSLINISLFSHIDLRTKGAIFSIDSSILKLFVTVVVFLMQVDIPLKSSKDTNNAYITIMNSSILSKCTEGFKSIPFDVFLPNKKVTKYKIPTLLILIYTKERLSSGVSKVKPNAIDRLFMNACVLLQSMSTDVNFNMFTNWILSMQNIAIRSIFKMIIYIYCCLMENKLLLQDLELQGLNFNLLIAFTLFISNYFYLTVLNSQMLKYYEFVEATIDEFTAINHKNKL